MRTTEDLMEKVDEGIERVGWFAIGVSPTVDDVDPGPLFMYSIGFYNYSKHPEFIIVGLHPDQAHPMLHGLFERVRRGERFEDGQLDDGVLEGYNVRFKALPPAGRPLNVARNYFELDELPALQVLWPDSNGVFPDEDGFEERFAGQQELKKEDL